MRVLAIDTSTRQVTVAIGTETGVLGGLALGGSAAAGPPRHTETLVPALEELLRATGVALGELTAVGVGIGPGMFTGLRTGVVTATMAASALGLQVAPIPTLDAVAQPLFELAAGAANVRVVAVVDARRAEVFHASYRAGDGSGERVSDDAVSRPADLARSLDDIDVPLWLCGDAAERVYSHAQHPDRLVLAGRAFAAPSPHALVALTCAAVERGELCAPSEIRPRYLRKSDAEINADIRSERDPFAPAREVPA